MGTDEETDVAAVIARQMPGWRLASQSKVKGERVDAVRTAQERVAGASIDDLKRKFLKAGDGEPDAEDLDPPADGQSDERDEAGSPPAKADWVAKVVPDGGGPPTIVEMRGGKLRRVSG